MFTGIIEAVGAVKKVESFKTHSCMSFQCPFSLKESKIGDSIAVNGCCLTVTTKQGRVFTADISPETLQCTNLSDLKAGDSINLERPLKVGDQLGGHWVQGHVDGVGEIISKEYIKAKPNAYYIIKVKVPSDLKVYMIPKGSVAIDGISLTVNQVSRQIISLCIIPHTQQKTTLTLKSVGDKVNIEADMILKYLKKLAQGSKRGK
ncbi:MAG: riboflavin synthase [Deltaproteobacteria bacterium]|nr:riboflavin synthase [Deltaproteobacteria bacterium]